MAMVRKREGDRQTYKPTDTEYKMEMCQREGGRQIYRQIQNTKRRCVRKREGIRQRDIQTDRDRNCTRW